MSFFDLMCCKAEQKKIMHTIECHTPSRWSGFT